MDSYIEESVNVKDNTKAKLLFVLCCAATVLSVLVMFFRPLFVVAVLVFAFLTWYFWLGLVVDYDYTLVNDALDIARIRGRSRRKTLLSINLREIELLCKADAPEFKRFENQHLKVIDASSHDPQATVWYLVTAQASGSNLVKFEPSEEMVKEIKHRNPAKVIYNRIGG